VKINESLPNVSRKIMRQKRVKHVLLYSCSRRVSLKVVLNLCHKIGFEVAKLPPQTRWRRPWYILSLSPAELRGAKQLGQGRALRARRKAAALPRPARQATNPCRVGGGLREPACSPPHVCVYTHTRILQYGTVVLYMQYHTAALIRYSVYCIFHVFFYFFYFLFFLMFS
jgi:hypothetical protein